MHGIVQRNLVTRVKGNEESTYRQGDVNLTPADLGAVNKDFSIYSIASTPYTGSELIPMRAGSDNVYTSINTLASQIGGGSGSEQTALVNYKKIISSVGGNGSFSQTFQDNNITGDMVLLEAHLDDPSIQTSDWTVTCSDSNNGQVTISGNANGTTSATLYLGVGMSTTPTILTNLESNIADNLLKVNPRPGVSGTLGTLNGGTGVGATNAADLRSKLGITPANIGAVATSGGTLTGNVNIERAGESYVSVQNTNTSVRLLMDSDGAGVNGLYSTGYWNGSTFVSDAKWMIYRNTSGNISVNGNAATATKATQDENGNNIVSTYLPKAHTVAISDVITVPPAIGSAVVNSIIKSGNVVTITLWISLSSDGVSGTGATIATVPNQYIPSTTRVIGGYTNSEKEMHVFSVNTSGEIVTRTTSHTYTDFINICATYIL